MREHWGIRRAAITAIIVAFCVVSPSNVAHAGAAESGTWQGTLTLTIYPCPGGGTCSGSFAGSLVGTAAGLDSAGHPFTVIWPDPTQGPSVPANLSATFQYSEVCPLGATGSAGGSFTLSGGYVDDDGSISHDGTLTGNFGWIRVGLAVAVETSGGVLTGGGQTLATEQSIGAGGGAFVPIGVPSTCLDVQAVTAQIAGSYDIPQ